MTMTIAIAVAVVLGFGAVVVWALARFMHEVARYSEWDEPIADQKRRSWK
jgi:hypothetical protein